MTIALKIPASTLLPLMLRLMILSSNHLLYASLATSTLPPSGFDPFVFLTVDGERTAARKFDYIVVGGGTAGCPLAATLSTKYSVLVVERGGSPYGNPDIENAYAYGKPLIESDNYTSVAQTFVSEDGVSNARARVMGGGTAINAGFYSRASREYVRNMSWDEELVDESYEWVEKRIAFKPDQLTNWSSAMRDGLLEAGVLPYNGYTVHHVEGTKISASTFDRNGKRHTAADLLNSSNPDNIVVLLNATVSRILFNSPAQETKDGSSQQPRASGVEFMDGHGRSYQVFLNESSGSSEVILSAGALGSPQVLLLSGIGPCEHLKEFNIPLVLHSPFVGQRIQDNPLASVTWLSHKFYSSLQLVGIPKDSQNYLEYASICGSASLHGNKYIPPCGSAVAVALNALHDMDFLPPCAVYCQIIVEKLAFPLSRGKLRLRSRDPRDNPSVKYNYYSESLDLQECVQGVRVVAKLLNTTYLREFILFNHINFSGQPLPKNMSDDAAVAQFCRDTVATIWHYHGGCEAGYVVNDKYQVKGVDSLKIVDGSTYRESPGTNPQATTMMLGRYIGMKILRERANDDSSRMKILRERANDEL